jgi:hypothetical protein
MASDSDHQWKMPQQDDSQQAQPTMRLVGNDDSSSDDRAAMTADGDAWPAVSAGFGDVRGGEDASSSMRMTFERREFRRFDVESWNISMDRWEGRQDETVTFGKVMDMSAGGVRLRTRRADVRADQQIRVRLELPPISGISPFVATADGTAKPTREWTGWLAVARVWQNADGSFDVAGRLEDMAAMDRGMLGLYLSVQPMAA